MIAIETREPIGLKSHSLHRMLVHQRNFPDASLMLLITRRPADAIASQLTRDLRANLWLTERCLQRAVSRGINDYLALVCAYRCWDPAQRVHVEFERMVDRASSFEYVIRLLQRLEAPFLPSEAQWTDLQRLTKDSQQSLGSRGQRRRVRLQASVDRQLSYEHVRDLLAS